MHLLRKLVQSTDFSQFFDLLSPTFFEVISAKDLASISYRLINNYRDDSEFNKALNLRKHQDMPVLILSPKEKTAQDSIGIHEINETEKHIVGQAVLELYFRQLMDFGTPTLLNLGAKRFYYSQNVVQWHVARGHYNWPPEFQTAITNVYIDFYLNQGANLEDALRPLSLELAADIFREHFAGGTQTQASGNQDEVEFNLKTFFDSFHKIFKFCKEKSLHIHPAFVSLGLYLASMYETLEELDQSFNVRQAFEEAYKKSSSFSPPKTSTPQPKESLTA